VCLSQWLSQRGGYVEQPLGFVDKNNHNHCYILDKVCLSQWLTRRDGYVEQPLGFIDKRNPNHYFVLDKVVYGLKQAPQTWNETLTKFNKISNFKQGVVDATLFRKRAGNY